MSDDFRFDGERLSEAAQKARSLAGVRRWVENMSAAGRRQATAEAGRRLGDWTSGDPEWRPSRGEVKAWVTVTEDDRRVLRSKVEALAKENEALTAQRDDAREEERTAREAATIYAEDADRLRFQIEGLEQTVTHVCRARDEALEDLAAERAAHDADVAELGDERDHWQTYAKTLDEDRTRRTRERDTTERNLHERTVEMTQRYEELRAAYDQAEGERNELARELHRTPEEMEAAHRLAYKKRRDGKSYRDIAAEMAGDPHFRGGPAAARRWVTEGRRLVHRDEVGPVEGRVECEHGVGVNFTTIRLTDTRGGAE